MVSGTVSLPLSARVNMSTHVFIDSRYSKTLISSILLEISVQFKGCIIGTLIGPKRLVSRRFSGFLLLSFIPFDSILCFF